MLDLVLAAAIAAKNPRIVDVTVYPDRAEVVREATVEVPAGASTVEFADIPIATEPDSLRVTAKGVPAILGAVEIRERADAPKETAELVALKAEVKRIEGEIRKVDADEAVASDLRDFLKSLRATAAQRESENLGAGRADPASIEATYAILAKKLAELGDQGLARSVQREKLQKDLEVAKAKLATGPGQGSIRTRVAAAEVEARQAGPLTLRLAYLVRDASWSPAYRATLDAESGEVALVSEGIVRQTTGEDWSGVGLRLSTAAPARGVASPELPSLLLRPGIPIADKYAAEEVVNVSAKRRAYQNVLTSVPEVDAAAPPPAPADVAEAAIVHSAYNVAFEVPGRSDVPSDGADHRVVLRQEGIPGTLAYRTSPSLEASAFLTSAIRTPADYPLLAGKMRALTGGVYLGVYDLPETGPGTELVLPFGRDNRIKVQRVPQPQDRSSEGFGGKTRQIAFAFKTTIENLRDRKVTVVLEDRVPVSEDERIVVEIGKQTTPGYQESKHRPGVYLWNLDLAPKEKQEVWLAYTVRHPRDLYVPGLE